MSTAENPSLTAHWIEKVYEQLIVSQWMGNTPNLFSLASISSFTINTATEKENEKRSVLEMLTKYSKEVSLAKVNRHLDETKAAYSSLGFPILDLEARLTYRAVVGASSTFGQTAFEVGLSFDPLLNVPYIPGSSIKGAVKAASRLGKVIPDDKMLRELFGNGLVGRLDFSDAYPVEGGVKGYILIPDVLTPHYSKGGEDVLEEDKIMPTPIPFLSIAPTTRFRFLIADRAQKLDQPFLETLLKAVAVAFSLGVGAKTALGYGAFELVKAFVEEGGRNA
ncbi:MAG: type III-B CRISPR module RAMP protein Cmr6 [Nitrososphaeria archaeon]